MILQHKPPKLERSSSKQFLTACAAEVLARDDSVATVNGSATVHQLW
jgi:hypothetical protein